NNLSTEEITNLSWLESLPLALIECDTDGKVVWCNRYAREWLPHLCQGVALSARLQLSEVSGAHWQDKDWQHLRQNADNRLQDHQLLNAWNKLTGMPSAVQSLKSHGKRVVILNREVGKQNAAHIFCLLENGRELCVLMPDHSAMRLELVKKNGQFDLLTGLYNRRYFERQAQLLWRSAQRQQVAHGVLYLDLDGFKQVNDIGGHAVGDRVLQQVANTLGRAISVPHVLARMGGDEFACLLPQASMEQAHLVGLACIKALQEKEFGWAGRSFPLSCSVGVSLIHAQCKSLDLVLEQADHCAYLAKRNGKAQVVVYEENHEDIKRLHEEEQAVRSLSASLAHARLRLDRQVAHTLGSADKPAYQELQLRHPDLKAQSHAALFAALARSPHLSKQIDRFVLSEALAQLPNSTGLLAIHISEHSLLEDGLLGSWLHALNYQASATANLVLVIPPARAAAQIAPINATLHMLSPLGIRFCLDELNLSATNIQALSQWPLSWVKLGREWFTQLEQEKNLLLLRHQIDSLHAIGLQVMAKQIDSEAQAHWVEHLGLDYAQGHFYHLPEHQHALA
ncbi:MAG: hypothetical protein RLZZ502_1842, partial [Pseudomonadota bacterium]